MRRAWVKRPPDGDSAVSCCQQRGHTISLEFYMTAGLFLAPVWSRLITEGFSGWLAGPKHSRGDAGSPAAARPPGGGASQAPWGRALGIQGPLEGGTSLPHAGVGHRVGKMGIPGLHFRTWRHGAGAVVQCHRGMCVSWMFAALQGFTCGLSRLASCTAASRAT